MKSYRHLLPTLLIALAALLLGSLLPVFGVLGQGGQPPTAAQDAASPDAVAGRPFPALTYQGNLNRGGAPYTGVCDFRFTLWPNSSGGRQIGLTQNSADVQVTDGLFTSLLLFGVDNGFVVGGENRFVQTEVKCAGDADFTRLTPRQALRPAPSALTLQPGAEIVDRSIETGVDALHVVQTTMNSQTIHGEALADGSIGVWGEGKDNTGVYGSSQGGTGVWGASTGATAVYGSSTSGTGVWGQSGGNGTIGVKGVANGAGSVGVWGESAANTGVYGQSGAAGGVALWGKNTAGGIALKAEGNAVQSLNMNGLPKAMVLVEGNEIVRCYNGVTGQSSGNCGFSADWSYSGDHGDNSNSVVNFGFNVEQRFIVANLVDSSGIDLSKAFHLRTVAGNQVTLLNWVCASTCGGGIFPPFDPWRFPMAFYIIVY